MKSYQKEIRNMLANPEEGPEIVVIGGGTGLSTMLRGLKRYTENLTAIVTVADDGGSSGLLRKDYGIIPPGDIRNCLLALADTEQVMENLMNYRFTEGSLSGQNFGNLFLTALTNVSGNFYDAIRNFSHVLAVVGRVLPVSLTDLNIIACLHDGQKIVGESSIGEREPDINNPIERILMEPADAKPLMETVEAIMNADLVVLGPGSLYTSVIPNLLFDEIVQALVDTEATCIYVSNIMTQPSETIGFNCGDHVKALLKHSRSLEKNTWLDYCLANSAPISPKLYEEYLKTQSEPVTANVEDLEPYNVQLITRPLVAVNNGKIRHDTHVLAQTLVQLALDVKEKKLLEAKTRVFNREDISWTR